MIFLQKPDGGCSTTVPRSCTCGLSRSLIGSCGLCRRASWKRIFVLFEPVLRLLVFDRTLFMRLLYHRSSLLVRPSPLEFFLKSGLVLMRFFQFDIAIFVYSVLSSAHVRRDRSRSRYLVLIVGCPMPKSLRHFSIGSPVFYDHIASVVKTRWLKSALVLCGNRTASLRVLMKYQ